MAAARKQSLLSFRSLLVAALDLLKLLCAQKPLENVTVDTLAARLDLAETYNSPEFKKQVPGLCCCSYFS